MVDKLSKESVVNSCSCGKYNFNLVRKIVRQDGNYKTRAFVSLKNTARMGIYSL